MSSREYGLLPFVRLDLADAGLAHLSPPWAYSFGEDHGGAFYAVRHGTCWLEVLEGPNNWTRRQLVVGDIVAIAPRIVHTLRDSVSTPLPIGFKPMPVGIRGSRSDAPSADQTHSTTEILAGWPREANIVLERTLPSFTCIPGGVEAVLIRRAIAVAEAELDKGGTPGCHEIFERLAEIVAIELLRMAVQQSEGVAPDSPGPFSDPRIMRALAAMRKDPRARWNVNLLAREAALSRSAFVKAFREAFGEPPMRYLTRIRIQRAAEALLAGHDSLAEIADAVGYNSESAFFRAFREHIGQTPGQYRRRQQQLSLSTTETRQHKQPLGQ